MKIAVILTARASWAKLEPVCRALQARPDVELQIIACASALLERYGKVVEVVKAQGYDVAEEIYSVVEGETLETASIETGYLGAALGHSLRRLRPDAAVVMADRHEVLAAAQAASYQHIPLIHCQGGERSGSIDDKVRDSITQLADVHCVTTKRAAMRVYGLTGDNANIHVTGCPSIDLAKQALTEPPVTSEELGGAGAPIDLSQPFVMVLQHPVTSEADIAGEQMQITLDAARGYQRLVMWPGEDAGASAISKVIRLEPDIHTLRNLPPNRFLRLLSQCAAIIGNSSASVRECAYIGTPAVVIGSRQFGREHAQNARFAPHDRHKIRAELEAQIQHGRYKSSDKYGRGDAGQRIADVICGRSTTREEAGAVSKVGT